MTKPALTLAAAAVFLLSAALPAAHAAAEAGSPDEKTRYEYAESLYRQGATDAAVSELTAFVKDYPKGRYTDDAYYWLGRHYMDAGLDKEGLDQFRIILALMPDGDKAPSAQFELAYHWLDPSVKERDPERALAEFLKVPFFYPDSPLADDAGYYAALCHAELGRYEQAARELREFIAKNPESEFAAPAGYRLGLALLLDGKTDEALAAFQGVRDAHPAGLMSERALDAVELVARARDARPLAESYRIGAKGDAPGSFYRPMSAAYDPEHGLYVADTGNSRVQHFVVNGGSLSSVPTVLPLPATEKQQMMDEPCAVAVGPGNRVYVLDRALCRVQVFTPEGGLVLSFGKKGSGPGELSDPRDIAVDEGGSVYVADRGNKRVAVFDPKGGFSRSVGTQGASGQDRALRSPVAVALDLRGNLLVADDSADAVYAFDGKGNLVMFYTREGSGAFQLKEPSGIAVDAVGNIYVTDMGRGVVIMFGMDLKPIAESGRLEKPSGLAVSDRGEVYVTDYGANQVAVFK